VSAVLGAKCREQPFESAALYTLIESAKLSGVYPRAWLTGFLNRIADHKINRVVEAGLGVTLGPQLYLPANLST
jgi:hypothetical protein